MRLVVVDVGNTSTAVGLWSDGRVSHVAHCDGGFAEASRVVESLAKTLKPSNPQTLALAYVSVVPKVDRAWRAFAKAHGLAFRQVTHKCFEATTGRQLMLKIDYPKPETIGADRLADAAGAVSRYGAPVLVMDFGTALTAAVVTSDRVWRGGVIAPGFPLMRDYLFERTAKLPRMKIGSGRAPKIGRSTEEAMRFGALVGYRGMVREIVAELKKNFKTDFHLVATGGFAKWVLKDLDLPFTIDPTLTLYGAGLIASGGFSIPAGSCPYAP
ncbi:MAG: type III pantothenate kinase [Kiritimatiellae bacterium]|nr:type III pantothenate kinase [Kiritimatiellia bacterium]